VPELRRLCLEIEPGSDRPVGSLTDERGVTVPFAGWLGLATALDRTLREEGGGAGPPVLAAPGDPVLGGGRAPPERRPPA
jgi:hypothetical protein